MKSLHLIFAVSLIATTACRVKTLVPLTQVAPVNLEYIDVEARFCTSDRIVAKQKMKYLFILDHSQSNQPLVTNPLVTTDIDNTDFDGARRYGPLVQFVRNIVPDPNNLTSFNLIDFNTDAYQPYSLVGKGFIQDPAVFVNTHVVPDWIGSGTGTAPRPYDQGFTNYQAALKLGLKLIKDDAQLESISAGVPPVSVQYNIIFVSDGVPAVPDNATGGVYLQDYAIDIQPLVAELVSLKDDPVYKAVVGSVSLNTAYYFQDQAVPSAQSILLNMANDGKGQYLEFAAGKGILYQSFAPPSRSVKMNFADLWIDNQNVVAWEDGRLLPDRDADGLPDEVEAKYQSSVVEADTDGNGVDDLVEYRTKGTPCKDAACDPNARDSYATCDGFAPTRDANGRVSFPSSSNDGLNDCEKFVLGANRTVFDSNEDFIPDALAFKNSIPFMAGTSGAYLNPFGDPLNHYSKLKIGLPVSISQKNLRNFLPRENKLIREDGDNPDVSCYRYTAKNVAVMRPGDVIRVYLIENSSIINNKPVLKTVSKSWRGGEHSLSFSRGEFN